MRPHGLIDSHKAIVQNFHVPLSRFQLRDVLYQKFLEFKYNQSVGALNETHLIRDRGFQFVKPPAEVSKSAIEDYYAFVEEADLPIHWQKLGGMSTSGTVQENQRAFRKLLEENVGSVEELSRLVGISVSGWGEISFSPPRWLSTRTDPDKNILFDTYTQLLRQAPPVEVYPVSLSGYFLQMIAYPQFADVDELNSATGQNLESYHEFRLPRRAPPEEMETFRKLWREFALYDLNLSFVLLEGIPDARYQQFLGEIYEGTISELNHAWNSDYAAFTEIPLPSGEFLPGGVRRDYLEFLESVDPGHMVLVGPEFAWKDWLRERYPTLGALNESHGSNYADWEAAWMPLPQVEMDYTLANSGSLRVQYASRNFINVFNAIFVEGRVFANTVIFTGLSVLFAVLINPLAAYAMSRFNLPGTYKILLLMMAVMAFPPMVTTIPTFIMMQNLGLMNTFAGLLLPTIANGYLIYLLKGFFDSLPKELYEAAQMEGASEFRMFFSITMALSKPILAVVGLNAFNAAYTVFLFALIIAPDQDMWLLPVWLYQYRETVSMGGVFASVLIASIPPIVIFIFAQNIILRGIVVPVEK